LRREAPAGPTVRAVAGSRLAPAQDWVAEAFGEPWASRGQAAAPGEWAAVPARWRRAPGRGAGGARRPGAAPRGGRRQGGAEGRGRGGGGVRTRGGGGGLNTVPHGGPDPPAVTVTGISAVSSPAVRVIVVFPLL